MRYMQALEKHGTHCLVIELDGIPYLEINARKHSDFLADLTKWKRDNRQSLDSPRVNARFFILDTNKAITEFSF